MSLSGATPKPQHNREEQPLRDLVTHADFDNQLWGATLTGWLYNLVWGSPTQLSKNPSASRLEELNSRATMMSRRSPVSVCGSASTDAATLRQSTPSPRPRVY